VEPEPVDDRVSVVAEDDAEEVEGKLVLEERVELVDLVVVEDVVLDAWEDEDAAKLEVAVVVVSVVVSELETVVLTPDGANQSMPRSLVSVKGTAVAELEEPAIRNRDPDVVVISA